MLKPDSDYKIDNQTFKRRLQSSFFSNAAGMIGGSAGAAIGCFIGNLVNPGLGGYVGSLIGGFLSSAGCSLATDRYLDP